MLLHPPIGDLREVNVSKVELPFVETHQWEVTLHGTQEAMPVLLGTNDGRLSFVRAAEEGRVLHPTF